jgi:hypothetical protein
LSEAVTSLIDLVLTEDTRFRDALPGHVETALITPLLILNDVYANSTDPIELVVAARLVHRAATLVLPDCPQELAAAISRLPR